MSIILADYAGSLFSLITTILFARNNILSWPLCIVANIVNLYLFYHTGIYADAFLEILYISMAIYGLFHWMYGGENHQKLEVSNISSHEALLLLTLGMIGYYTVNNILTMYTDSTIPRLDALAMILSLIGQWLGARKFIETWAIWFITDIILATIFMYKALPAHFILNIIYLPIVFYGYRNWAKIKKNQYIIKPADKLALQI